LRQAYDYWQNQPDTLFLPDVTRRRGLTRHPRRPKAPGGAESTLVFTLEGARRARPAAAAPPAYREATSNHPIAPTVSPPGTGPHAEVADPPVGGPRSAAYGPRSGRPGPCVTPRKAATQGWRSPWIGSEENVSQRPAIHTTQTTPETQRTLEFQDLTPRGGTRSGVSRP
jgi:hypothetical protein